MKKGIPFATSVAVLAVALLAGTPASQAAGRPCEPLHIVGGGAGYCAIRNDGRVACWGGERGNSPRGRFRNVSLGTASCGVRDDGEGVCWGSSGERLLGGGLLQLSVVDWVGAHAIRADGTLDYLPFPTFPDEAEVPEGTFVEISAGCARRTDKTLECLNGLVPPTGKFEQVAGPCAIDEGGKLQCWGGWEEIVDAPPGERYRHVSSSNGWSPYRTAEGVCAVTEAGAAGCWGENLITTESPDDEFREVAFGYGWPWGLTTDGRLIPWAPWPEPTSFDENAAPVIGTFAQIAAGGDGARPLSCGLEASGRLACWGNNQFGQISIPDGDFVEVGAGAYHACGRRDDNTIECWGYDQIGDTDAPAGSFTQLAIGYFGPNCARRSNGTVACWGYGEAVLDVPAGAFQKISAGAERACGLDDDGDPTCWRYVEGDTPSEIVLEPVDAPDGPFAEIAMYYDLGATRQDPHFCGRRPNGQAICWTDKQGTAPWTAPGGTFTRLSSGGGLACGIRTNGHIECWGPDWIEDYFLPPEGEFVAAAGGAGHVCGLTDDGSVVCTGGDRNISICAPSLLCGNGDVDDSETCDDGDVSFAPGDACTGGCWGVPCGQPVHPEAEAPLASDALFALRAAVGATVCSAEVCDVNATSTVTTADALAILRKSVNPQIVLGCV